jgi:hypothetical protein
MGSVRDKGGRSAACSRGSTEREGARSGALQTQQDDVEFSMVLREARKPELLPQPKVQPGRRRTGSASTSQQSRRLRHPRGQFSEEKSLAGRDTFDAHDLSQWRRKPNARAAVPPEGGHSSSWEWESLGGISGC